MTSEPRTRMTWRRCGKSSRRSRADPASQIDGIFPAPLERLGHRFGPRARFELAEHGLEMEFDRMQGNTEAAGDRLVGETIGDGIQDLRLTRREERPRFGFLHRAECGTACA